MLRRIGAEEGGELKAIASGTLPSGRPVVVNADGTVSVVAATSSSVGSTVTYNSGSTESKIGAAYDSNSNKVVIAYKDGANSNYGTAIVGTVSGTSISFGTEVVFLSSNNDDGGICFDSTNNKIVITTKDTGSGNDGKAFVGTVSGTSISFGSAVTYETNNPGHNRVEFDSVSGKVAVIYTEGSSPYEGRCRIGTVSGTSISFGTEANLTSSRPTGPAGVFNSDGKLVLSFRDYTNSLGKVMVGTISGTSISFGSETSLGVNCDPKVMVYDSSNDKVLILYADISSSDALTGVVATVSGTSVSVGTAVRINGSSNQSDLYVNGASYNASSGTIVTAFRDRDNSNQGTVVDITISGTSLTVGSETVFETGDTRFINTAYDSTAEKTVINFRDVDDSENGKALVYTSASENLTSENYIGMSRGVVSESALSIGATSVVNTGTNGGQAIAYDTNSNRVVIAYRDNSNYYGKAVVGTVSGSSITFGTPATFNAATTIGMQPSHGIAFDSSNNKVVIVYKDNGNSSYGTAIVGTVDPSDNSISFGSEAVFESAHTTFPNVTFDSSANKVLISYCDYGDSSKGKAIVGTVSGTSISFGSAAEFEGGDINHETLCSTFDSANNKVVIAYRDGGDSNKGKAVVATVSGTSVSFGTPVEFSATNFFNSSITFDSTNNKIIIVYGDNGNSNYGTAVVGTVSGTAISFGSTVVWNSSESARNSASYSSTADKTIVFFRSGANSDTGRLLELTTSGTSVTASSTQQFSATTTSASSSVFDPDNNVVVNAYIDEGNSTDLETVQVTGTTISRVELASGQAASMDIIGSISDNQIGLTAGQQYFVQTNGTIGETAATPSVLAGTAISATELLVKT